MTIKKEVYLKLDTPNNLTTSAINEGKKIAYDDNTKGYSSIADLKNALEV